MIKKSRNKEKTTFILSDASFNRISKTSVGVIIDLNNGEKQEHYFNNIKNALEAEKKTMLKAIQFAANKNIKIPVFVSDNKYAVQQIKKDFFESELLKSKFIYAQFLWLPREFLHVVDFFTKNLNLSLLEKEENAFKKAIDEKTKSLAKSYGIFFDDILQKKDLKKMKRKTISDKEKKILNLLKSILSKCPLKEECNADYIDKLNKWEEKKIEEKISILEGIMQIFPELNILIEELIAVLIIR